MSPIDFVAKIFNGEMATSRAAAKQSVRLAERANAIARQDKFFAAANPGINRPQANQLSTPDDYRQAYERIVMIRYGRQLEEDVPYVGGILGDFETYVVGELKYRPNTGNTDADRVITEHLEWRFSKDQVDMAGLRDLTTLAKIGVRSKIRDGECGFIIVDMGDSLKLAPISADRIGNPLLSSNGSNYNFNGIVVDPASGRPVEYEIFRRLPKMNAYVFDKAVKAEQFIHFSDPFRFEQYHGITSFKNGITTAIDIDSIIKYAMQNMKFRSAQLPVIQNEQGRPRGTGYQAQAPDQNGIPQPFTIQIDGVQQNYLRTGEAVVEYPHDFPNANFKAMVEELKGDIALGVNLPPEFCYRSSAGGVLQRFYINKAERTFDEQKRTLKQNFLNPFKNRVIQKDIDTGFLDLSSFPGLSDSLNRFRGTWHMGRSVSTDYGRDTDADIKLIEAGLMSPEEHMQDNARDYNVIRAQTKQRALEVFQDSKEIAGIVELPVSEIIPFIQKRFPNPILREQVTDKTPDIVSDGDPGPPLKTKP